VADDTSKDDKTEDATPRRLEESRDKGQVAMSSELVAALMLIAALGSAFLAGGPLVEACGSLIVNTLGDVGEFGKADIDATLVSAKLYTSWKAVIGPFAALVLPVLFVGAVAGYGQVGFLFTPKAIAVDPTKVNPMKGFARIFSMRGVVRTGLAALKIVVVAGTVCTIAWGQAPNVAKNTGGDLLAVTGSLMHVGFLCLVGALIAILVLALVDFIYQRFQHEKDMRMSKKEVREEQKSSEGDPKLKAKIRQVQRELATNRMMEDVPDATVVITNPTHYAVALKYNRAGDAADGRAPICVAKGVDHVAQRIKKIASENGVILYENVPLARALHAQVEIGEQISEELFHSVAEVLSYVYGLKGESAFAG